MPILSHFPYPRGTSSSSGVSTPLDPKQVYNATRPADWLPMPTPQDDEMYLLFHIPDGVSSLIAFTATCASAYTVETGTVVNGEFVPREGLGEAPIFESGAKYEAELHADNYGDLTSDGFKQVMIKVSGEGILTWRPSIHSKKTSPQNFATWNIVEIVCNLTSSKSVQCGNTTALLALNKLRYYTQYGTNSITNTSSMFSGCYSLIAIPQLDTSKVTNTSSMFNFCYSLIAIPQLDTSKVTNTSTMFRNCYSLIAIPQLDTSNVTNTSNMFYGCSSFVAIPQLDTSNVTNMSSMCYGCYALIEIPQLDTSNVASMNNMCYGCYSLSSVKFNPVVTSWAGYALSLSNCSLGHTAIVELFNSLPTITNSKAITLTGNPGVSELTNAEKAIATGKNWTLTL